MLLSRPAFAHVRIVVVCDSGGLGKYYLVF